MTQEIWESVRKMLKGKGHQYPRAQVKESGDLLFVSGAPVSDVLEAIQEAKQHQEGSHE